MRYLSLCSGIEAASVAWLPLGWTPVAFAEIDPFRCELLAHYWPDVPNLGDLTEITAERIAELGPIDLVVGGTPCQDLSIAGQRAGIDGARSRLFFDFVRVFDAARTIHGARWCVWENTPGALSTNAGRDFARVVATLAGIDELDVPADGWGNEGVAVGPNGLVEWSELDAQWFHVAQRRERVFVVLDVGNWADRPPVLLEPESVRGDSPPSREAGSTVAGTLRPSAFDGSSTCGGDGRDGLLVPEPVAFQSSQSGDRLADVAPTLDANYGPRRRSGVLVPEVAGPLLSSSNGAGWRTGAEEAAGGHLICDAVAEPLTALNARMATHAGNNPRPRNVVIHAADVAPALTAREGKGPDSQVTSGTVVACFDPNQVTSPHNRSRCSADTAALVASPKAPTIAFKPSHYTRGKDGKPSEVCPALTRDADKGDQDPVIDDGVAVRRLTPIECERLQGFPDGWTAIRRKSGKIASDTQRYAALGDSIATTVLRWIGEKIDEARRCSAP